MGTMKFEVEEYLASVPTKRAPFLQVFMSCFGKSMLFSLKDTSKPLLIGRCWTALLTIVVEVIVLTLGMLPTAIRTENLKTWV
jgi:hypothetical protein